MKTPTTNDITYTLADFLNSNGLVLKIQLISKTKKGALKVDYLNIDDGYFGSFKNSTTFEGTTGAGQTLYDAGMVQYELSKYLNTKIEVINLDNGNGIPWNFDDEDLDEEVTSDRVYPLVKSIIDNVGGVKMPPAVEKAFKEVANAS